MTEQEKIQTPLTPFAKGGNSFMDRYFHCHLVPTFGINVSPENTNIGEKRINKKRINKKRINKKRKKAHPLKSPLNGGMNSTIPLLGGVPFTAGRVLFIRHPDWCFPA